MFYNIRENVGPKERLAYYTFPERLASLTPGLSMSGLQLMCRAVK
jgi:hypothetical protein